MGFGVEALGEGFSCALVRNDLLLELVLHFFQCFASLRAHTRLCVRRLPQLVPKSAYFSFGDVRRFLCFGEGGGESVDFLLQGCGCRWVGVNRSGL